MGKNLQKIQITSFEDVSAWVESRMEWGGRFGYVKVFLFSLQNLGGWELMAS